MKKRVESTNTFYNRPVVTVGQWNNVIQLLQFVDGGMRCFRALHESDERFYPGSFYES